MARKVVPRWRKLPALPLVAALPFDDAHCHSPSPRSSFHACLQGHRFLALPYASAALLLIIFATVLAAFSVPFGSRRTARARYISRGSADLHAVEVAERAVAELHQDYATRLSPSLFRDDETNTRLLVRNARIPPVFVSLLGARGRERLLRRLTADSDGVVSFSAIPRLVVVHVQNGLGNRLRALGSAMEFAFYTRRILVVVWARDAHLNAAMSDLFAEEVLEKLIVIDEEISWPVDSADRVSLPSVATTGGKEDVDGDSVVSLSQERQLQQPLPLDYRHPAHDTFVYYNQMDKDSDFRNHSSRKSRILNHPERHVYVKTAYLLNSAWAPDHIVNALIQSLTPAPVVLNLVHKVEAANGGPHALAGMIGVHIRSRGIVDDNEAIDYECEYSVQSAAITDQWRRMSTPVQFLPEMARTRQNWPKIVEDFLYLRERVPWPLEERDGISMPASGESGSAHVELSKLDTSVPPKFFVSTDSLQSLNELRDSFEPGAIVSLPRDCEDRGPVCIIHAFADIVALSRTGALLGSGWSSFSEAANRLRVRPPGLRPSSKTGYTMRLSGIDFGSPSRWERLRNRSFLWLRLGRLFGKSDRVRVSSQSERRKLCRDRHRHGR